MVNQSRIQILKQFFRDKTKPIIQKLDQTLFIQKLNQIDELIGKKQSRFVALSNRSLRYQKYFTYGKQIYFWFFGTIFILSWGRFSLEPLPIQYIWPDQFMEFLVISNNMPKRTPFAIDHMLQKGMESQELDSLSYVTIGRMQSQINYSDLAYTSYYMAHLKDHTKFGANSDLSLDTSAKQSQNQTTIINEE